MAQEMTDKDKAIGFDSDVIALQDLVAGRVDAVITDQIVGGLAIKKGLAIKAVGEPFAVADQAIAVRKDEPELLANLNKAIEEAKADGTYKALSMKWLGQVLLSGVQ
jgi:polar amino acid transport system substrate-binding protein